MNGIKRKLKGSNELSVKKRKKDFGSGGAWKIELVIMVKDECDVRISSDIAGLIHEYSVGWWEECISCKQMTDPSFAKSEVRLDMDKKIVFDYYCKECEEEDKHGWKMKDYVFGDDNDDMI